MNPVPGMFVRAQRSRARNGRLQRVQRGARQRGARITQQCARITQQCATQQGIRSMQRSLCSSARTSQRVHNNAHHDKGESLADVACRAQPRATTSRGFPLPPRLREKRSPSRGGKAAGVLAMWTRARLIFGLHETSSVGGK